ncbi:hypothetical protein U1Q18_033996, partial [Sarracenia purpurea var. burkii]
MKEQGQSSQQPKKEDSEALVNIGPELAVLSYEDETYLHTSSHDTEWVVDIAASYHALLIVSSSLHIHPETM